MEQQILFLVSNFSSFFIFNCGGNSLGGSVSNSINLQPLLDKVVNSKEAQDAFITGIPMTFQCNGLNNNQPVSFASGKINNRPGPNKLPLEAIFQIGSITKSFTAVVALQLADEITITGCNLSFLSFCECSQNLAK